MSKNTLRSQLIEKRNGLSVVARKALSDDISNQLFELLPDHSLRIGSYIALGSEVDLTPLHAKIMTSSNRLYIPRILSKTTMEMAALDTVEQLTQGAYGIQTSTQDETIAMRALDWLIIPCSGFDRRGYRLGMGGGYYDRALENCPPETPVRIGVAFATQESEFEPDPWDQSFDWIITENEFIRR